MPRIIIAVDDGERSADAVSFGAALARASGAAVTVAHAYPWHHLPLAGTYEANEVMREESERTIQRVSGPLRDLPGFETRSLADSSPARGLQDLAEEQEAGLIVVGSSSRGRLGRVLPGNTAERLLHGSPCAVAVVPHGYEPAPDGFRVIGCGWDGSTDSDAALAAAEGLTLKLSASLRIIRVVEPPAYLAFPPAVGVGYEQFGQATRIKAERGLEERLAHLPDEVWAAGDLREGPAAEELLRAADGVDLLVLGSRGYGPLEAVLLGGVSGRVVREAECPVLVVPNAPRRGMASVFVASTVTAAQ